MVRADRGTPDHKPKSERRSNWLIVATIAGCALILTAIFGGHGLVRWLQCDQEKRDLTASLEKIENQNVQIRREIDSLIHNGKYIETIARRELGMVKADEIIYQFPKRDNESKNSNH